MWPDGKELATASQGEINYLAELTVSRDRARFALEGEATEGAFSADGRRLATIGDDLSLRVLDLFTGTMLAERSDDSNHTALELSPDGGQVAVFAYLNMAS